MCLGCGSRMCRLTGGLWLGRCRGRHSLGPKGKRQALSGSVAVSGPWPGHEEGRSGGEVLAGQALGGAWRPLRILRFPLRAGAEAMEHVGRQKREGATGSKDMQRVELRRSRRCHACALCEVALEEQPLLASAHDSFLQADPEA